MPIKPMYAEAIPSRGTKTVELRSMRLNVPVGILLRHINVREDSGSPSPARSRNDELNLSLEGADYDARDQVAQTGRFLSY